MTDNSMVYRCYTACTTGIIGKPQRNSVWVNYCYFWKTISGQHSNLFSVAKKRYNQLLVTYLLQKLYD